MRDFPCFLRSMGLCSTASAFCNANITEPDLPTPKRAFFAADVTRGLALREYEPAPRETLSKSPCSLENAVGISPIGEIRKTLAREPTAEYHAMGGPCSEPRDICRPLSAARYASGWKTIARHQTSYVAHWLSAMPLRKTIARTPQATFPLFLPDMPKSESLL